MKKYCLFLLPLLFLHCRNQQEPSVTVTVDGEEATETIQEEPSADPSTQQGLVDLGGEEEATTSLLAQRSAVNQEDAMNGLIRSGTPLNIEPQAAMYKDTEYQVLERTEPVLSAYKNLSIFAFLDDLLWFDYYQSKGLSMQTLGALQETPRGIVHEGLDYPLVRQNYWAEGGIEIPNGNKNYRSVPGGRPKVEDLQNDPYRALISLYELSLNKINVEKLRREQDKSYYLFHEENPFDQAPRPYHPQPSFWANMVYQKARGLIEVKKQEQEARLEALNSQLSVNASVAVLNTTLDEILSILNGAIQSYPVQTKMREFFEYEYRRYPDASSEIISKGLKIRRHQEVRDNPRYASTLPANGIKAIEGDLVNSLLPSSGVAHLQSKYEDANKTLNRYQQMKTEMEGLLARLGSYQMTADESQYFAAIQSSVQYLIDTWQITADQFKELHELPAEEKKFDLIPLIQLGENELQQKLSATPGVKDKELTIRKLKKYYYEQVRQAEAAFKAL